MGTLQFYIPGFQNDPSYPNQKEFLKSTGGKLEIIQFILSDEYMDGPGQGQRHILWKIV